MARLRTDPELIIPDDILIAEYEYIADTAKQANEDRSRVSVAFSILFLVLTLLGTLTIAQLARLRAAWHESIEAMNQIKDFYIKKFPETEPAFKWRIRTIPPTDKPYSIANLIALEVALLGALTTAAAFYFILFALGEVTLLSWMIIAISFAAGAGFQWWWYKHLLVDNR